MGTPAIWLGGALVLCLGLFFGAVTLKHQAEVASAHREGVSAGKGAASTAALEAAAATAAAEREATEATPLPADRAEIIALCKRSASCRERGMLK